MIKILVYDTEGGHFNGIVGAIEHYSDEAVDVHRIFNGLVTHGSIIENYVINNDIDIVIIPYSGLSYTADKIVDMGCVVIKPYNAEPRRFTGVIQTSGTYEPERLGMAGNPGLDFYSEATNYSEPNSTYGSFVAGKVAGLSANLLREGYNGWEVRQILRQNCDRFDDWTTQYGFGYLPDEITIPDTIYELPPSNVNMVIPHDRSLNKGLGILTFNAVGGGGHTFNVNGDDFVATESPFIFEGEAKTYNFDFSTEYGSEFSTASFTLESDYFPKRTPKKVELIMLKYEGSTTRFRMGTFEWFGAKGVVQEELEGDQIEYRVYNSDGDLIFQGLSKLNNYEVYLDSLNNPEFSLRNYDDAEYTFNFRYINRYGIGEWSEDVIMTDTEGQNVVYDFRDTEEDDDGNGDDEGDDKGDDEGSGDDHPKPPTFPSGRKVNTRMKLLNAIVEINGEPYITVGNAEQIVNIDLDGVLDFKIKRGNYE